MAKKKKKAPAAKRMVMKKEDALKIVAVFIRKQGFKDGLRLMECERSKERWSFQFSSPRGLFYVDKDGNVEDGNGCFSKKNARDYKL